MADRSRVLALLCATQFLLVLDVTIVGVALPAIRADLGFDAAGLQWVVSAYVLAFGGLLLLGGRLCDVLGQRALFVAGLAVFGAGSLACGLAGTAAALVTARAVQGAGAALATPAALALLTTTFPPGPQRVRALGVWTAAAPVGGATGLLLGGALTQALGWRWNFLVGVPVAACALALAPRVLPKGARRGPLARIDLPGALTGTAATVALVFALSRAEAAGFGDPAVLGAMAAGAGAAVCFALWERRARDPLLPPGTLRCRPLARAMLVSLVLPAATSPPLFFLTLHLQGVLGWSPAASGLAFLPVVVAVVAGASLAPRAIAARGATAVMASGLALVAAGAALLTGISADGGYATAVLPGQLIYGVGLGAGSVAATTEGTAALPAQRQGIASGLLNTAAQIGTALGLAVLVAVAALPHRPVDGFRLAFAADAGLVGVAALAVASSATAPSAAAARRRRTATHP